MKPVVCLVGPTGVGKTSYARRLKQENGFEACKIFTTRGGRDDDGSHITHVSLTQFRSLHDQGLLLECDHFNQQWYGSSRDHFWEMIGDEKVRGIILDLTPEGIRQVRMAYPEIQVIILMPDNPNWIERRLRERGTDDEASIASRLTGLQDYLKDLGLIVGRRIVCAESPSTWDATFNEIQHCVYGG